VTPTVLVATTRRWVPTARLAIALRNAGFTVDIVCPSGHPVSQTASSRKLHKYRGLAPLHSFAAAIAQTKPDLIIPGDDLATFHLHGLFNREVSRGNQNSTLCQLIEKSIGAAASFPVIQDRTAFLEIAWGEGIRVPRTDLIASVAQLNNWVNRNGFPVVLKANGTSGGDGVKVVHTFADAKRFFESLGAPPLLARAIKRSLVDSDHTLVWPSIFRQRSTVSAHQFISGWEATSSLACFEGKVLAALHFEVLLKSEMAGPATVLKLIENPEMSAAAEKIVKRLNLSGLHGLDYMLEAQTGDAYLIEINPRSTQVGHLTLGSRRDLPAALYSVASGKILQEAYAVTKKNTIALFPQEWLRDSDSTFLKSGYHDVPWEEPKLIDFCVRGSGKGRSAKSQEQRVLSFWKMARTNYEELNQETDTKR
jgi:hypothetical protein